MVKNLSIYSLGDRVVHHSYGIGKIDGIEYKPINGVEVECFKVKTANAHFWFPTEGLDNRRIHPVASQDLIQKVIKILRSAPQGLESDQTQWKERIDLVQSEGDILAISGLVRDLVALKTTKKLSQFQNQALKTLQDRLLREWAASSEAGLSSIRRKLQAYLKESKVYITKGNENKA